MRVSRSEMDRSHERIVEGAARLFREHGVESTSVADVMDAAGMTHGGFYRHFENKDALLAAAIESAFAQIQSFMEGQVSRHEPEAARAGYHAYYLSTAHLDAPGAGCPVAMLAGDVARATPSLKEEFGRGLRRMIDTLAGLLPGTKKARQTEATREFALLVGAAVIARASDPETAKQVLAACRPLR